MNHNDRVFFDAIAPEWDSLIKVSPGKISHILDLSLMRDGDRVLDVGTGTGVLIPFIGERIGDEGHIDAIDISEGMLNRAKQKFADKVNVDFKCVDVEKDNLADTYNCIMMYCMYPHLLSGEDTVEWLVKLNLRKGGSLVIAFPESKEGINSIHRHNDGSVHSHPLAPAESLALSLRSRGLNVDYIEDTDDFYIIRISKD